MDGSVCVSPPIHLMRKKRSDHLFRLSRNCQRKLGRWPRCCSQKTPGCTVDTFASLPTRAASQTPRRSRCRFLARSICTSAASVAHGIHANDSSNSSAERKRMRNLGHLVTLARSSWRLSRPVGDMDNSNPDPQIFLRKWATELSL